MNWRSFFRISAADRGSATNRHRQNSADERVVLKLERVSRENFDESRYLLANPDVAAEVRTGAFKSGWMHFEHYGEAEGRQQACSDSDPFTFYEARAPRDSNALDLFKGRWSCHVPGHGYGSAQTFSAPSMTWFIKQAGGVREHAILELGPLEGGNTYMLAKGGANVTAIEGNSGSFLRCLIAKEVLRFNARFLLGDFVAYLRETKDTYDAVIASGVIYHMLEPVKVLRDLMRVTNTILIWTHYFDAELIETRSSAVRKRFSATPEYDEDGNELWHYSYLDARDSGAFCGGPAESSKWLTKASLLNILERGGFSVVIGDDETEHPNGPAVLLLARRRVASSAA